MTIRIVAIALTAALYGSGCNKSNTCVEGASTSCACPGGGSGAQVCTNGAYGACSCGSAAAAPAPTPAPAPAPAAAPVEPAPTPAPAPPAANDRDHDKAQRDARDRLDKATHELDDLAAKVNAEVAAVKAATNDHERKDAQLKLEELQKQQLEQKGHVDEAKKAVDELDHHR